MKKESKHICNPQPVKKFGLIVYQCGCGRYFTKEQYEKTGQEWRGFNNEKMG